MYSLDSQLKIEINVINMEKLNWDAYNESETLLPIIESYKIRSEVYPERIFIDKVYRTRPNLSYFK